MRIMRSIDLTDISLTASTAYLNCKGRFESLGFMDASRISKKEFLCHFLSVEENPSF